MEEFIRKIPKILLHVHLEGTLQPELCFKLAKRNNIKIPYESVEDLEQAYDKLENLVDFLKLYYQGTNVLCKKEDYYDLTLDYLKVCVYNNVKHIELMFDPQAHTSRGVSLEDVITGINEALNYGKDNFNISFKIIMNFLRDLPLENALEVYKSSLIYRDLITAIGLDSDEINNPPSKFAKLFEIASKDGFKLCCHGGHDGDAIPYVSELLDLNLNRIDHGVKCTDNDDIFNRMKKLKIPMTICPISNVKIGPYNTINDHPVQKLYLNDFIISINCDDPAYLRSDICENFIECSKAFGWEKKDIVKLVNYSIQSSFMNEDEKLMFEKDLNTFLKSN